MCTHKQTFFETIRRLRKKSQITYTPDCVRLEDEIARVDVDCRLTYLISV